MHVQSLGGKDPLEEGTRLQSIRSQSRTQACTLNRPGISSWGSKNFQFSSVAPPCPTLCDPMEGSTPGLPVHHQLRSWLKLMSIESVMPSNHLILCRLLLLLLPSISPSIRVFSSELALPIRWPKYWSFSLIISPFNEYSGLISFMSDWFDCHAVQGSLDNLP